MSHHLGERRDGETVPAGEYQSSVGSDTDRRAPHVCLVADSRAPGGVGIGLKARNGRPAVDDEGEILAYRGCVGTEGGVPAPLGDRGGTVSPDYQGGSPVDERLGHPPLGVVATARVGEAEAAVEGGDQSLALVGWDRRHVGP